jgi:hypothetical protein
MQLWRRKKVGEAEVVRAGGAPEEKRDEFGRVMGLGGGLKKRDLEIGVQVVDLGRNLRSLAGGSVVVLRWPAVCEPNFSHYWSCSASIRGNRSRLGMR